MRHAGFVYDPQPLSDRYLRRLHEGAHVARELLAVVLAVVVVLVCRVGVGVRATAFGAEPAQLPSWGTRTTPRRCTRRRSSPGTPFPHCREVRHGA